MEKTTLAIIDENEEPEIDVVKKPYSFRFSDDQIKMIDAAVQSMDLKSRTKLLEYKDTDTSHLTNKDYETCIKKVNFCVLKLIEKIHFNPDKPENMNIYISNIKDKYLMVYQNGKWNLKNKKELDQLYDEKEYMIEQWIEENKDPEMEQFFKRYLHLKKDDKTMQMINDELKLMMFNNKNLIE